jgi:hypothetical protein
MKVKEFSDIYSTARCRYNKIKKFFLYRRPPSEEYKNSSITLLEIKGQAEREFRDIKESDLYDKNIKSKCYKISYLFYEALLIVSTINEPEKSNIECCKNASNMWKEKWQSALKEGEK